MNPRYSFKHTRFPSVHLRPLGHLSKMNMFLPVRKNTPINTEREGFEPSELLRVQRFSRPPDSTTLASLQLMASTNKEQHEAERIRTSDLQIRNLKLYPAELQPHKFFGAGGIRTPGTLSGYNSLAGSPIRPLSHRSKECCFLVRNRGFGLRPQTSCLLRPGPPAPFSSL